MFELNDKDGATVQADLPLHYITADVYTIKGYDLHDVYMVAFNPIPLIV